MLTCVMSAVLTFGVSSLRANPSSIEPIIFLSLMGVGEVFLILLSVILTYIYYTRKPAEQPVQRAVAPVRPESVPIRPEPSPRNRQQLESIPEEEFAQSNPIRGKV